MTSTVRIGTRGSALAVTQTTTVAEALAAAGGVDYELVRISGRSPEELLAPLAELTAAINDSPLDDLELEEPDGILRDSAPRPQPALTPALPDGATGLAIENVRSGEGGRFAVAMARAEEGFPVRYVEAASVGIELFEVHRDVFNALLPEGSPTREIVFQLATERLGRVRALPHHLGA